MSNGAAIVSSAPATGTPGQVVYPVSGGGPATPIVPTAPVSGNQTRVELSLAQVDVATLAYAESLVAQGTFLVNAGATTGYFKWGGNTLSVTTSDYHFSLAAGQSIFMGPEFAGQSLQFIFAAAGAGIVHGCRTLAA